MRILFTGHRDKICNESDLDSIDRTATWIHGGAIGFDSFIESYARKHNIKTIIFKPNYNQYGKFAPLRRNDFMLKLCDEVVALYDGRKYGGTYYTITRANELGIPIMILEVK